MKESTFIELLNLYIDQQISPEDAAQLEEEILSNPQRRRVYREYCKMQRACTLVLENLGSPAELETAAKSHPPARRAVWGYYAGGLAAACVALVAAQIYLHPARETAQVNPAPVPAEAASAASLVAVPVRLDMAAPGARRLQTDYFLNQRLFLRSPADGQNAATLVVVDAPRARVPLRPLSVAETTPRGTPTSTTSIEQFVFQPNETMPDSPQIFRIRRTAAGQEEMTAYQFQR